MYITMRRVWGMHWQCRTHEQGSKQELKTYTEA